tara:strand:+ start:171 stop:512 length:342 start_codon:yes stop_codon:yes gene_type:complete
MFNYIKRHCDFLVVGIDSDKRVSSNKGPTRPFNNQTDRKFMLKSLRAVDEVFIFNNQEGLENLVKMINPDIMIVGSDYENKKVIGSEYAKELKFFRRINGYSTTNILEDTINR